MVNLKQIFQFVTKAELRVYFQKKITKKVIIIHLNEENGMLMKEEFEFLS